MHPNPDEEFEIVLVEHGVVDAGANGADRTYGARKVMPDGRATPLQSSDMA